MRSPQVVVRRRLDRDERESAETVVKSGRGGRGKDAHRRVLDNIDSCRSRHQFMYIEEGSVACVPVLGTALLREDHQLERLSGMARRSYRQPTYTGFVLAVGKCCCGF